MSRRRILGLDWFDVVVHGMFTVAALVMTDAFIHGPAEDAMVALVLAVSVLVLGVRRKRALAASPSGEEDFSRLAELEVRLAELEAQQPRMFELEERLEFAERLLARQREREPGRLPGGGQG